MFVTLFIGSITFKALLKICMNAGFQCPVLSRILCREILRRNLSRLLVWAETSHEIFKFDSNLWSDYAGYATASNIDVSLLAQKTDIAFWSRNESFMRAYVQIFNPLCLVVTKRSHILVWPFCYVKQNARREVKRANFFDNYQLL